MPLSGPLLPFFAARRRLVGEALGLVSQLRAAYRDSPVSVDDAQARQCDVRPGQRLPDATITSGGQQIHRHDLLALPGVHVLLHDDAPLVRADFGPHVHLHRLPGTVHAGVVAVLPDGYVGYCSGFGEADRLHWWLNSIGACN